MSLTRVEEERNSMMMEKLNRNYKMHVTNNRLARLVAMTHSDFIQCEMIFDSLTSKLAEETPDYNAIITTINGVLDCLDYLISIEFQVILVAPCIFCRFYDLRLDLYYHEKAKFKELLEGIDDDLKRNWDGTIPIKYRSELTCRDDLEKCYMIVFPESIDNPIELTEQTLKQSDLSAIVRDIEVAYGSYSVNECDGAPDTEAYYRTYTVVLIEFGTKLYHEEALQTLFPEAILVDESYKSECYQRYFQFESNFRKLIEYDEVVSRH